MSPILVVHDAADKLRVEVENIKLDGLLELEVGVRELIDCQSIGLQNEAFLKFIDLRSSLPNRVLMNTR